MCVNSVSVNVNSVSVIVNSVITTNTVLIHNYYTVLTQTEYKNKTIKPSGQWYLNKI